MSQGSAAGRDSGWMELPVGSGSGLKLPSLKHWRKRRGLTQKELARKLGLRLAEVLEVDLAELQASPPPEQKEVKV